MAGYYGIMLAVRVSICLSICRLSVCLPVQADAKYIPRLAFVLMSGLFHHCGIKICFVGLKIGVVGLKEIKERSKG